MTKRYHAPETPCARLLQSASIPEGMKDHLRAAATRIDPLAMLDEIRSMQHHLAELATGAAPYVVPQRDNDLERFMKGPGNGLAAR